MKTLLEQIKSNRERCGQEVTRLETQHEAATQNLEKIQEEVRQEFGVSTVEELQALLDKEIAELETSRVELEQHLQDVTS